MLDNNNLNENNDDIFEEGAVEQPTPETVEEPVKGPTPVEPAAEEPVEDPKPDSTYRYVKTDLNNTADDVSEKKVEARPRFTEFKLRADNSGSNSSESDNSGFKDASANGEAPKSDESNYSYTRNPQQDRRASRERRTSDNMNKGNKNPIVRTLISAVIFGVVAGAIIICSFFVGSTITGNKPAATIEESIESSSEEQAAIEDKGETADNTEADEKEIVSTPVSTSGDYTVAEVAAKCKSSVVAITSKGVQEVMTMFGTYQQESEGSGSGVIIGMTDTELLIVTNNHVVEGSNTLTVCFNDSEDAVYTAQIKGTAASDDLAVVSVPLADIDQSVLDSISIATFGDSDEMKVGDQVVAIGNALGMGQSVTSGYVSVLAREMTIEDTDLTLMQTDAAINPGNSGGALFNMKGELIGINSAKYSSESVEGMGFAIPINTAKPIIEQLQTYETRTKLESGYGALSIKGGTVSDEAVAYYKIPAGVYVSETTQGGAAANAGLQEGDIITGLGGRTVTSISDLQDLLKYYPGGETVDVTIQRNNGNGYEEMTISVTLDTAATATSSTTEGTTSGKTFADEIPSNGSSQYGYGNGNNSNGSSSNPYSFFNN